MLGSSKTPMPWDIMVFITITTVGFGFSVQRLMSKERPLEVGTGHAVAESSGRVNGIRRAVDLGCLDRLTTRRIHVDDPTLRLRGRLCAPDTIASLRVLNTTTGREGTVFLRDEARAFLTDGFSVKSGKNVIRLEWVDGGSPHPHEVVAEITAP